MLPRTWGTEKKRRARDESVVRPWRDVTALRSLPAGSQYWTLCGNLSDGRTGALDPDCELSQMLDEGLISAPQFHGVELDLSVHSTNVSAVESSFPHPNQRPHLYNGDFVKQLDAASAMAEFNPALVNIDTPYSPRIGFNLLAGTLAVLNASRTTAMVVWNVQAESRFRGVFRDFREHLEHFKAHSFLWRCVRLGGWKSLGQYEYGGTAAHSVTKMLSFVLWNGGNPK